MKPVLIESETIIYVDDAKMVRFISENAPMEWNEASDFMIKENITNHEGSAYWSREEVFKEPIPVYEKPEGIKWLRHFFDAHPWLNRIKIVFDD